MYAIPDRPGPAGELGVDGPKPAIRTDCAAPRAFLSVHYHAQRHVQRHAQRATRAHPERDGFTSPPQLRCNGSRYYLRIIAAMCEMAPAPGVIRDRVPAASISAEGRLTLAAPTLVLI
ncbi:MAG: hypothetical protein IT521_08640 [Burkholderiales bacterium]|nr:hypothetical protein [Burkholderiales bacterium]